MALSPRAWGLGPLETIVNVGWPSKYTVQIEVSSGYNEGPPHSRTVSLELTSAGIAAGGVILSQDLFNSDDFLFFTAFIEFKRVPPGSNPPACFIVNMAGAFKKVESGAPPVLIEPFCATTTIVITTSPISARPNVFVPGAHILSQVFTISKSGPGGGESNSHTIDLANVTLADVGTGASSATYSLDEMWYQDGAGNFINMGIPCDAFVPPEPGDPPAQQTRIEGFGMTVTCDGNRIEMGSNYVGLNQDFVALFDDLPDGAYPFAIQKILFSNIPPPQPAKPGDLYRTRFPYPLSPPQAAYALTVFTAAGPVYSPPKFFVPGTLPPNSTELQTKFPAGAPPPSSQIFELDP